MTGLSAQPFRHRLLVAATTAATAILLLSLGLEYGPKILSPEQAAQGPAPVAYPAGSTTTLELSIFEQPHTVPEINFQDDQGHNLTLADFRGRVVLLNVWATWCVPCRQEMPTLDRLQARLGGKDFLVIALSIDRKGIEAVQAFYKKVGVENLAIYIDLSGKGSHSLAIPGVPTTLLIDRQGREVARKMGESQWDSPEMVSLVERTMGAPSASEGDQGR